MERKKKRKRPRRPTWRRRPDAELDPTLRSLGRRLRELRKDRDLSQERLARAARISRTFLGSIELGAKQPTLATLVRLARALKVPLAELFFPSAEEDANPSRRVLAARLQSKLLDGPTVSELRKISDFVEAVLRRK